MTGTHLRKMLQGSVRLSSCEAVPRKSFARDASSAGGGISSELQLGQGILRFQKESRFGGSPESRSSSKASTYCTVSSFVTFLSTESSASTYDAPACIWHRRLYAVSEALCSSPACRVNEVDMRFAYRFIRSTRKRVPVGISEQLLESTEKAK